MNEQTLQELNDLAIKVDTSIGDSNYIKRLIKYHQKGFDLVIEDLDINKIEK